MKNMTLEKPDARAALPGLFLLALAALLLFSARASAQQPPQKKNSCLDCHSRLEGPAGDAARQFAGDIHKSRGLSCNDCHGNHGATPPGVASVANVCGQCHARQAELFRSSPHKAVFDNMQVGECIRCHSNHGITKPSDQMLGTGEQSVCTSCHKPGDKGFAAAGAMRSKIDELREGLEKSHGILDYAERAGMEVSRPKFELREGTDALTNARVVIHSSSTEELNKVVEPGLDVSKKGYQAGQAALDERSYRRKGLAVSLFFILFLAALVYLKVRDIEAREILAR
jgi:predicted CXXCH cytochrome family protein